MAKTDIKVKIIGADSNIFNLLGICRRALQTAKRMDLWGKPHGHYRSPNSTPPCPIRGKSKWNYLECGKNITPVRTCKKHIFAGVFCWNKCDFLRINIHLFANHPVDFGVGFGEAAENHFFDGGGDIAQNCFKGDLCCLFFWEMVNSG